MGNTTEAFEEPAVKSNKTGKIILGIITFWPALYAAIFAILIFSMIFSLLPMYYSKCEVPDFMKILLPVHIGTLLLVMGLFFYYLVHVSRNDKMDNDLRPIWVLALILGNVIVMPVYWFFYIWEGTKKQGGKNGK